MEITVLGRNCGITDRFRSYAEERAEKITPLAYRPQALEIRVSRHSLKQSSGSDRVRVEMTLVSPGPVVRSEADADDKYAALDTAVDKMVEQLRRARDRRKIHRGRHRPNSLAEVSHAGFQPVGLQTASVELITQVATGQIPVVAEDERDMGESPVVIRQKVFAAERLTSEEAVDRMELVGHDFYLFVDATNDRPSVVYRRRGWQYGVIALDVEAVMPSTLKRASRR